MPAGIAILALIRSRMMPRAELNVAFVYQAPVDVCVSAQRIEVMLGVVVQRRFVAHSSERRIGVGVERHVVRVVVHVGAGVDRHELPPVTALPNADAPSATICTLAVWQRLTQFGQFVFSA